MPAAGRGTVVDFWATWCEPCVAMLPQPESISKDFRAQGVAVFGVATDDNPGLVQSMLRKHSVTYANVLDDAGGAFQGAYRVTDLPATFVLDRGGRVRYVHIGSSAGGAIRRAVRALIDRGDS